MLALLALACTEERPDRVVYTLQAPGLGAPELEEQGLVPLERELLPRARSLRSRALPGEATLSIEIEAGVEAPVPDLELPPGMTLSRQVLREPEQRATLAVDELATALSLQTLLEQTPCIAEVELVGGEERLRVTVDPEKLAALDLSMSELASHITSEPLDKQVVKGVPLVELADFERRREGPHALLDDRLVELLVVLGQGCGDLETTLASLPGERLPDEQLVFGPLHPEEARLLSETLPPGPRELLLLGEERASLAVLGEEDTRVVLHLLGPRELLEPAAQELASSLRTLGEVEGARPLGRRAIHLELDREAAARFGIPSSELAWTQKELQHPEGVILLGGSWEDHLLRGSHGLVPLTAVTRVELGSEPVELLRIDGRAAQELRVRAPRAEVQARIEQAELPPGVRVQLAQ